MELKFNKLLIIDGSNLLYRNLKVQYLWDKKNSANERIGGVYGVLKSIQKELNEYKYYPVVVFDGHLAKRRLALYNNYKHNAEKRLLTECKSNNTEISSAEFKYEYQRQKRILDDILPMFKIPVVHFDDWEGDDLIYVISKLTKDSIILSDDKDMYQLLYRDSIRQCRIKRGMCDEFIDIDYLMNQQITPEQFICHKAILGDVADNIKSACQGVGEKSVNELYNLIQVVINNNLNFPTTEDDLHYICSKYNIDEKISFLNFDQYQYNLNMHLIDLSYVDEEISQELINVINEIIFYKINSFDNPAPNTELNSIFFSLELNPQNCREMVNLIESLTDKIYINASA